MKLIVIHIKTYTESEKKQFLKKMVRGGQIGPSDGMRVSRVHISAVHHSLGKYDFPGALFSIYGALKGHSAPL